LVILVVTSPKLLKVTKLANEISQSQTNSTYRKPQINRLLDI